MSSRRRPDRPTPYLITRRDQVAALRSAVRQEIVDTIQAAGPRSVAEMAVLTGRPADALYYHIKRLMKVGLLVVSETRISGRRDEAVFDLVGHPLVLHYPVGGDAQKHPLVPLVRSMVRTAERDYRITVGTERARPEGPRRNLWAGRRHAWLSTRDLARVNRLLDQMVDVMTRARNPAQGELCTLTLVLAPRTSRGGRRRARS